jgi:hypothetical protein
LLLIGSVKGKSNLEETVTRTLGSKIIRSEDLTSEDVVGKQDLDCFSRHITCLHPRSISPPFAGSAVSNSTPVRIGLLSTTCRLVAQILRLDHLIRGGADQSRGCTALTLCAPSFVSKLCLHVSSPDLTTPCSSSHDSSLSLQLRLRIVMVEGNVDGELP